MRTPESYVPSLPECYLASLGIYPLTDMEPIDIDDPEEPEYVYDFGCEPELTPFDLWEPNGY